ncbi:MAG: ATP-binding protein, partial [Bacteroidales bacterium]|nr:ATP-binding protein [Bacteroidales bacterium]
MDLVGRKSEIRLLKEYLNSQRAEFIAVYGRRRIGKTYLIDEFFGRKYAFCISGVIDGERSEQMSAFVQGLRGIGYNGSAPKTWMDAFFALRQILEPTLETD